MAPSARNPVVGHFALELDGKVAGFVRQVTGGGVHADVIEIATPRDKHIGQVRFEDLVLTIGTGLSRDFHDWVASTVSGTVRPKNGAVLACDFNYKVLSRLEWTHGLIRAVNFPALDAASKDQAALTVKITPESTRPVAGDGSRVNLIDAAKTWLASNFRLVIDGLEIACNDVSRIETITIAQNIKSVADRQYRFPQIELARRSLGDLVVRLPESRAKPFYNWPRISSSKAITAPPGRKTDISIFCRRTRARRCSLFGLSTSGSMPSRRHRAVPAQRSARSRSKCTARTSGSALLGRRLTTC